MDTALDQPLTSRRRGFRRLLTAYVALTKPRVIELLAAVDNKAEPEDLPLAPWS